MGSGRFNWCILLLFAAALVGLLGQEAAAARAPLGQQTEQLGAAAARMSPDCAEMAGPAKQQSQTETPCKCMMPDCIAKMGCAAPLAVMPSHVLTEAPHFVVAVPLRVPAVPLGSHNTGPEPEPPTFLG